jgi:thiol-disulfide isomerase/thioredoxin
MNRRYFAVAGVAAVAGLAGWGAARWSGGGRPGSSGLSSETVAFWGSVLETPEGQALPLQRFSGQPLLVNFWATWCPPCVEELPLLNRFYLEQRTKGWNVLGIAIDQPSAVRAWLAKKPLAFAVGMAGLQGTELSKSLGNQSGGLPFSLVFAKSGAVLHQKSGQVQPAELAQWAAQI